MARKQHIDSSLWPALTIEGHLISPAMLMKISKAEAPEQKPSDYRLRKGIEIKNEVSNAFVVGQAHYLEYKQKTNVQPWDTLNFVEGLLREAFGFDDLVPKTKLNRLVAGKRVPIRVGPLDTRLDVEAGSELSIWQLKTDGLRLRLMRDNQSLTRPAYIDADMQQMFDNEDIASFRTLWLLIHRTRFEYSRDSSSGSILERWKDKGMSEGEDARDHLAGQIKKVLSILGSGFLEANPKLAYKLQSGEIPLTEWFNELLRLVYMITFILVSEDRNQLYSVKASKTAIAVYKFGYSLDRLRRKCFLPRSSNKHFDSYEGLKVVFKALSSDSGQSAIALPSLGGVFDLDYLATLKEARLKNDALLNALYKLTWIENFNAIMAVNWRDMKTEELGSIYESLLDLNPQLGKDLKTLTFADSRDEKKGSQRRTTGCYYTPDSLVELVIKTTLDGIISKTESNSSNEIEALLNLTVIDPACGSGRFLLAAANRIAKRIETIYLSRNSDAPNYQSILRIVIRRCIFGVDINPMAVEITKFVLWLESLTPGKPLGFFDAQIKQGDSLIGVFDLKVLREGVPDAAFNELIGDSKALTKFYKEENSIAKSGQGRFNFETEIKSRLLEVPNLSELRELRQLPENSLKNIKIKKKEHASIANQTKTTQLHIASNLYVAAFLIQKNRESLKLSGIKTVPTTQDVWNTLSSVPLNEELHNTVNSIDNRHVFHWPLEFSDIFENGGFDVVIGNPPWERVELNELEFFANRHEEIATNYNSSIRKPMIESLKNSELLSERMLHAQYVSYNHFSKAVSNFVRCSQTRRFPLTGKGKINTFALFAELFVQLRKPSGFVGIITPTGIATDSTTSPFFTWLLENSFLSSFYDFLNKKKFFRDVHAQFKFSVLSLREDSKNTKFSFFLTDVSQIEDADRKISLTYEEIECFNPNTKASPILRSRADKEILVQVHRNVPILENESKLAKNTWGVKFLSMYNMTTDSKEFKTHRQLKDAGYSKDKLYWIKGTENYLPLYEAKMIAVYNHRFSSAKNLTKRPFNTSWPLSSASDLENPTYEVSPWYWVSKESFEKKSLTNYTKPYWIGIRDVSNSTSDRTVMGSVITHTALSGGIRVFATDHSIKLDFALLANLNSIVLDYIARLKVGGNHLAFHVIKQLPIILPEFYTPSRLEFVSQRVLKLVYTSYSLGEIARLLRYDGKPFDWDGLERATLCAELDAFYTKAYGLNRQQLRFILDPADIKGTDYPSETFRVLKKNEIKEFGVYRTQKLVLAAWDRLESEGTFTKLGM